MVRTARGQRQDKARLLKGMVRGQGKTIKGVAGAAPGHGKVIRGCGVWQCPMASQLRMPRTKAWWDTGHRKDARTCTQRREGEEEGHEQQRRRRDAKARHGGADPHFA